MIEQPRLRSDVAVDAVDGDKLFFNRKGNITLLESATAVALAPDLDGTRTLGELLERHSGKPVTTVMSTLTALERKRLLVDGPAAETEARTAFWDATGLPPVDAEAALAGTAVRVVAVGNVDPSPIASALRDDGIALASEATNGAPTTTLVVCDDYLHPELDAINREAVAGGRSWLLVNPTGARLWLGPAMHGGETACWECLASRLRGNRQLERYMEGKTAERVAGHVAPALASTLATIGGLVATEVARLLGGDAGRLTDRMITIDLLELESERHEVVRLPQCPACGDPGAYARRPATVTLAPRRKQWVDDGGHRVMGPEDTYARLKRHVSPITGAISTVTSQNREEDGVTFSYSSGHNFALMQDSTYFLKKNMRGRSGGKGRTDLQARVGAICEAVERFNGVWRGDEPRRRASFDAVGELRVDVESLLNFGEWQYADRDAWNASQVSSYHVVPEHLDPALEVDWSPVWSLRDERERLVPSAYCWFGHPDLRRSFFCACDANGNAAGNTLEEAILQGLMELVERDSVALWWYNRARRRAFDLDSLNEPYVDMVREHYATMDRTLWMLDLTSDLGIPAFAGVSQRRGGPSEDLLIGFGAHIDPHTAAMRALTEVNQFLPAVRQRRPDGTTFYWMDDPDAIEWWSTQTLEGNPYLAPDPDTPPATLGDFERLAGDDIAQDVRTVVGRLADAGMDTLVLDQTRPDIELSVAKVMVPGLRHFWRRLGPGRLYDVPVSLGWLDAPHAPGDLNPYSIFF